MSTTPTFHRDGSSPISKISIARTSPSSGTKSTRTSSPHTTGSGKTILVDGVPYQVIGVFEKRKGQLFKDETADRTVKVPYHSYRKALPADDEHFIGAEAYAGYKDAAEDEIRGVLRRRRNTCPSTSPTISASPALRPSPTSSARS